MKKILLIAFLLLGLNSFAQDIDIVPITMPTDEEIKETIDKFDFDQKQKEYLFKEIKRKFEELYLQTLENKNENLKPVQ